MNPYNKYIKYYQHNKFNKHKKLFGTDGIRGTVNMYPMTSYMALKFGMAAGIYLLQQRGIKCLNNSDQIDQVLFAQCDFVKNDHIHNDNYHNSHNDNYINVKLSKNNTIVNDGKKLFKSKIGDHCCDITNRIRAIISKDTRLSGYLFESAITAGLIAVGVDVTLVGPMPTPSVPMLVRSMRADLGIMITASHNPYQDNGFKLFDSNGFKMTDISQNLIENIIHSLDMHCATDSYHKNEDVTEMVFRKPVQQDNVIIQHEKMPTVDFRKPQTIEIYNNNAVEKELYNIEPQKKINKFSIYQDEENDNLIKCDSNDFIDSTKFLACPNRLGRANRLDDVHGRYIEYVKNAYPRNHTLSDVKIVLDCANGAAYKIAPTILWELGADITTIGCNPNGLNINSACGSNHPQSLISKVLETKADIGIAFDGDADRVLICDENGIVIHGDYIIGLIASYLLDTLALKGCGIVCTTVSNSGLQEYIENNLKLKLYKTNVGDRYIAEEMRKRNCNFGGEQSGHIIIGDYNSTGDGIVAALHILAAMRKRNQKVSELFNIFDLTPQINLEIQYKCEESITEILNNQIKHIVESAQNQFLGAIILVRKSGTEKLLRVMIECNALHDIKIIANFVKSNIEMLM